jgi:Mg2+-importing ATPase
MDQLLPIFWNLPAAQVLEQLGSAPLSSTLVVDALTLVLPYTPLADFLGFSPIPPLFVVMLGIILVLYMLTAEVAKHFFYRRMHFSSASR